MSTESDNDKLCDSVMAYMIKDDATKAAWIMYHSLMEQIKLSEQLEEALRFCSGSADFGLGGQAEEGWNRLCEPLLKGKK